MINLLPYDMKKELRAARVNNVLLRYSIVLLASGLFLGLLGTGIYLYIGMTKTSIEDIASSAGAGSSSSSDVEAQVLNLQQQVSGAKTIVDSGIKYSKVLIAFGQSLPEGVVIEKLNLTDSDFNKPINLDLWATNTQAAGKINAGLSGSQLFSGVTVGAPATSPNPPLSNYPVNAKVTITINKEAAL